MDVRRADLHMHTTCSDGRLAPAALVAEAHSRGLHAIAVTDHDTVAGVAEAAEAAAALGIEVVPGVELSVTVGGREVHLLGYFFDPAHEGLCRHLDAFAAHRSERARRMVGRLNMLGIPIRLEEVMEGATGAVGRPHVAQALVDGGFVASYREAFDRYISDGGPAFVPKPTFDGEEALRLLHDAGGIGVLAHPGHWTGDATVMALVRAGLDGIEVVHPSHDAMLTRYYRELARDFGLIETGGSDYHGIGEHDEDQFGRYTIPFPQLERIRRRAA